MTLRYASLVDLREAVRLGRRIRFIAAHVCYTGEPHMLFSSGRTGALHLLMWVESPDEASAGWRKFAYSSMRSLEVLRTNFPRRPMGSAPERLHLTA